MIARPVQVRAVSSIVTPCLQSSYIPSRSLHHGSQKPTRIPRPTPFVPDVQTFLTVIGRNLKQHAPKIPTWSALFSLTSPQLKELGVEPPRARRYLLRWRQKFRNGQFGIGGDAKTVVDGKVPLRIVDVQMSSGTTANEVSTVTRTAGTRRAVVNLPLDVEPRVDAEKLAELQVAGVKLRRRTAIAGAYVLPLKGGNAAEIQIQEGIWEDKRGKKIDGGERRQAEVRWKRRGEERRAARS